MKQSASMTDYERKKIMSVFDHLNTFPAIGFTNDKCGRTSKVNNTEPLWILFHHVHAQYGASIKFIKPTPLGISESLSKVENIEAALDANTFTDAEWKARFVVDWCGTKYIDEQTVHTISKDDYKKTIERLADKLDTSVSKKRWVPKDHAPATQVVFYGMQSKETDKAFLIAINNKSEWFPKSKTEVIGTMQTQGPISMTAYKTEDWLLVDKYGKDMADKFVAHEDKILEKLNAQ